MAFYGVGLEDEVKMQTKNKSDKGIKNLKVIFKRYDANGSV